MGCLEILAELSTPNAASNNEAVTNQVFAMNNSMNNWL